MSKTEMSDELECQLYEMFEPSPFTGPLMEGARECYSTMVSQGWTPPPEPKDTEGKPNE